MATTYHMSERVDAVMTIAIAWARENVLKKDKKDCTRAAKALGFSDQETAELLHELYIERGLK